MGLTREFPESSIQRGMRSMVLYLILVFTVLTSIGSVAVAGLFLAFPEKTHRTLIPCLISYASGTLLGTAFLGLIPHALANRPASVCPTVVGGIVLFFFLEKLLLWRHCHGEECEVHAAAGPLIIVGDAFHNLVDGLIISATFLTSVQLGVATSLAIISHEIPQEVGDFAILLHSGYSKSRAMLYNLLSSLASLVGAVMAYFFLKEVQPVTPYLVALAASSFIYIATVDLIPELHRKSSLGAAIRQLTLMLAGIGTVVLFHLEH